MAMNPIYQSEIEKDLEVLGLVPKVVTA